MCCGDGKPIKMQPGQAAPSLPGIQTVYGPRHVKNPLQAMANSLPRLSGRIFKPPKVHEDGSIEYERGEMPPNISGYERDANNPFIFHPLWPPCWQGMYGLTSNADGAVDVVVVCNCPQKQEFQRRVQLDVCLGCPFKNEKTPLQN